MRWWAMGWLVVAACTGEKIGEQGHFGFDMDDRLAVDRDHKVYVFRRNDRYCEADDEASSNWCSGPRYETLHARDAWVSVNPDRIADVAGVENSDRKDGIQVTLHPRQLGRAKLHIAIGELQDEVAFEVVRVAP